MHIYVPGLCVGLIVGAYWARVLRMIVKTRRRTGSAANFLPPELLGRLLRFLWLPTVALWIVVPLGAALLANPPAPLSLLYDQPMIGWIGVAAALAALVATVVCWKRMGTSWRMGIDPSEKTRLVVTGPYAFVRHPIYALSSALMVASVVAIPVPLMIVVACIHLILLQWEARREEKHLSGVHGEQYEEYLSRVGRFVPKSLTPYSPAAP